MFVICRTALASFFLVLVSSCVLTDPLAYSTGNAELLRSKLQTTVPELMQQFNVPGVALVVLEAEQTQLLEYFGHTDETRLVRINEQTVFEAASLGKPLFAHALLQDDCFDPNESVASMIARSLGVDPRAATITGQHLLSHTSGLRRSETTNDFVVDSNPGEQWRYSGLGYSLLQFAYEQHCDTTLTALVENAIVKPLALQQTAYLPRPDMLANLASGHDRQGKSLARTQWTSSNAGSSLHTTASDYGKFLGNVLRQIRAEDSSALKMLQTQVVVDPDKQIAWGTGWAVARHQGETMILHWGSNPGFKSLALGSVDRGRAVVMLTNGDNGLNVARAVVSLVFEARYEFLDFYMLNPDD